MEWYERINVCGIYKKFIPCNGNHKTTTLGLWTGKNTHKPQNKAKPERYLKLVTPWGTNKGVLNRLAYMLGMRPDHQKVALGITLLLGCLEKHVEECSEIIIIKTNVSALERYISKDCYPAGLRRQSYLDSIKLHRLLATQAKDGEEGNRMM